MTATVFSLHLQKVAQVQDVAEGKNRPWGIEEGLRRLDKFFARSADWSPKGADGRVARQIMLYHTGPDGSRLVRDQFLHSCHQVLRVLMSSVNAQRNNGPLGFLQVRRTRLTEITDATGFARSTVIAVVRALKRAGVLRTQRRKTDDKAAELVAVRWLTPALFDMLGLGGWISKQSRRESAQETAAAAAAAHAKENPGADRRRDEKPAGNGVAGLYAAMGVAGAPPPRKRTEEPDK